MTDTAHTEPAAPAPDPPQRRDTRTTLVLAVVAAVAVVALAAVAVVAVTRDDGGTTVDSSGMPGSTMGSDHMMNGTMSGSMSGSMAGHGANSPTVPGARQVAVAATSFRFTPSEIHVRAGEDVTIALTAADLAHDFTIDELGVHVVAAPGQQGTGGLHAPDTAGTYTAYCSVSGHRDAGMKVTVVVDA